LIGGVIIAASASRIDEIMQPFCDFGIEDVAGLLERLEAIGVENL
jgi:hypothetical protein